MFVCAPAYMLLLLLCCAPVQQRYYNREAVVISALQVEKHPLTTPGPYSTPPLGHRPFHNTAMGVVSAFQMTPVLGGRSEMSSSRTGSPVPRPASGASGSYAGGYGSPRNGPADGYRSSPKPHSSPKMKLRFPNLWTHTSNASTCTLTFYLYVCVCACLCVCFSPLGFFCCFPLGHTLVLHLFSLCYLKCRHFYCYIILLFQVYIDLSYFAPNCMLTMFYPI